MEFALVRLWSDAARLGGATDVGATLTEGRNASVDRSSVKTEEHDFLW